MPKIIVAGSVGAGKYRICVCIMRLELRSEAKNLIGRNRGATLAAFVGRSLAIMPENRAALDAARDG